jgi:hypothetical protein
MIQSAPEHVSGLPIGPVIPIEVDRKRTRSPVISSDLPRRRHDRDGSRARRHPAPKIEPGDVVTLAEGAGGAGIAHEKAPMNAGHPSVTFRRMSVPNILQFVPENDAVSAACPCCGSSRWKYLGERLLLLISEPKADVAGSSRDGIEAVAFVCRGCRFIRLQAVDV